MFGREQNQVKLRIPAPFLKHIFVYIRSTKSTKNKQIQNP